ncbi:unnamed protein product [Paramecium sonneborni]|uniref:Transmembrane protein n=1 Tax=Paramecium sonneborni TaxID=65129 RepID=A0A8S1R5F6_9CILI|nr:unnamed protein product [Paramecium sonneborni]
MDIIRYYKKDYLIIIRYCGIIINILQYIILPPPQVVNQTIQKFLNLYIQYIIKQLLEYGRNLNQNIRKLKILNIIQIKFLQGQYIKRLINQKQQRDLKFTWGYYLIVKVFLLLINFTYTIQNQDISEK